MGVRSPNISLRDWNWKIFFFQIVCGGLAFLFISLTGFIAVDVSREKFRVLDTSQELPILRSNSDDGIEKDGLEIRDTIEAVSGALLSSLLGMHAPVSPTSKVAFMFITGGPLPLERLWARFFEGHEGRYSVYVHPGTSGFSYKRQNMASDIFCGRAIPSKEVSWGTLSAVDAERALLAWALLDLDNVFFVLLSESCIPIRGFPFVYRYLLNSDTSFVDVVEDFSEGDGAGRYENQLAPLIPRSEIRKGSQWFAMHKRHALAVVSDFRYYKAFRRHCQTLDSFCFADEHYIQTFLHMVDPRGISNHSVTYTKWEQKEWHPKTLQQHDVSPEFIRETQALTSISHPSNDIEISPSNCYWNKERRPCFLFARKVDPSAVDAILNLSKKVLGF